MTAERWEKVRDILEQALELAPEKRSQFLDDALSIAKFRSQQVGLRSD